MNATESKTKARGWREADAAVRLKLGCLALEASKLSARGLGWREADAAVRLKRCSANAKLAITIVLGWREADAAVRLKLVAGLGGKP